MHIPQALAVLIGVVFFYSGIVSALNLRDSLVPSQSYFKTEGEILKVVRHTYSDEDGPIHLAEVSFWYEVEGKQLRANTLTPLCSQCTPNEVVRVLGMRPSQVPAGMRVAVFVLKPDPKTAYLALAERSQVIEQLVITFLFLVIVPWFMAWNFKVWANAT